MAAAQNELAIAPQGMLAEQVDHLLRRLPRPAARRAAGRAAAFVLQPLFDEAQLRYLRATRLRLHCHEVEVTWDADGRRYGGPAGLAVGVDRLLRAHT